MSEFRSYRGDMLPTHGKMQRTLPCRVFEWLFLATPWKEPENVNMLMADGAVADLRKVFDDPNLPQDLRDTAGEMLDNMDAWLREDDAASCVAADD